MATDRKSTRWNGPKDRNTNDLPYTRFGDGQVPLPPPKRGLIAGAVSNPALLVAGIVAAPLILVLWGLTRRRRRDGDEGGK